jgi:hypothetical protein
MRRNDARPTLAVLAVLAIVFGARSAQAQATSAAHATPTATIVKPKSRTVSGGICRLRDDGTLGGTWGPSALPVLAFTIGPGSAMADQMHANKAKYTGPGRYVDVIIAVYLGATATADSYGGLGTVVVNPDGRSGTFTLNDGTASGTWSCGGPPVR